MERRANVSALCQACEKHLWLIQDKNATTLYLEAASGGGGKKWNFDVLPETFIAGMILHLYGP